ncbi:MAG: PA14 domain-containing protein [Pirellulaceae bacterium]
MPYRLSVNRGSLFAIITLLLVSFVSFNVAKRAAADDAVADDAAAPAPDGAVVNWDGVDGRFLLTELKCAACHTSDNAPLSLEKTAPILAEAGARITPQYLRRFLGDPQSVKPGTPMPDVLHHLGQGERRETVELLTHYLASLGGPIDQRVAGASVFQIERGKELFHRAGCVACHEPVEPPPPPDENDPAAAIRAEIRAEMEEGRPRRPSVPLGDLASKTTVDKLTEFLLDPLHVRPSGRMPSLALNRGEANMIAAYLLREQLTDEKSGFGAGIDYAYYEGGFPKMPDFDSLKPKAEGSAKGFDLNEIKLDKGKKLTGNFAVRFRGLIEVPQDGMYEFFTRSDDGAVLHIDGQEVLNNDGFHPPQNKSGKIKLTAGRHPIEFGFTQGGGGFELSVEWKPPRGKKEKIPAGVLLHSALAMVPRGVVEFQVDADKAERGKELFGKLGCAACHQTDRSKPVDSTGGATRGLEELKANTAEGCLGERVAAGRPKYLLSESQRTALVKAVEESKTPRDEAPTAAQRVAHLMTTFNCYACHVRDDKGGPEARRVDYFTTLTTVDLGEEGRLAPPLNAVGAKLTPAGFEAILFGAARFRPHMATRMPQFGKANLGHLPELLKQADADQIPPHEPEFSSRLVDDGRRLVGKQGLGCINCHAWGQYKLQGADGLDLLELPKRLETGWYHAFLTDPQKLKPGTRMPTAWPGGKSFFPDIQGGDVDRQMDAIWAYLSVGEKGGVPNGLSPSDEYVLVPGDEPIVFRTFVGGVGAHAIGVGFRQRTHVVFDALRVRMALAWTGEFLSAKPAWDGRAGQYASPSGGNLLHFAPGSPLAVLESADQAWPEIDDERRSAPEGWRFIGYRYDKQRVPSFVYQYGDVAVEETPGTEYRQDAAVVTRKFRFTAPTEVENLYHRVAVGNTIEQDAEGRFVVDGKQRYRINAQAAAKPILRRHDDQQELLVPVELANTSSGRRVAELEIELTW